MIKQLVFGEKIIRTAAIKDNAISYVVYENGYFAENDLYGEVKFIPSKNRDKDYIPPIPVNEKELENYTALLLIQLTETSYILADTGYNWTMNNKTLRLIMMNSFILKHLNTGDPVSVIFQTLIAQNIIENPKFIKSDNISTTVYIGTYPPEWIDILMPYVNTGEIIKQDKL